MKITDLLSLNDFIAEVISQFPDIDVFVPLSNGEKAIDEISAYYTNDYGGKTAFLQTAEIIRKDNLMTFQCSLTVAIKPENNSTRAGLEARNTTFLLLMQLLGKLALSADESAQTIEDLGDMYELSIDMIDSIFPIALLANVDLEGHYIDLDITVPATHLLFPA